MLYLGTCCCATRNGFQSEWDATIDPPQRTKDLTLWDTSWTTLPL